jgi:hypothetical protein
MSDEQQATGLASQNRAVVAGAAAAVVTVAAYLLLLGWHAAKTVNPETGRETGPYDAWQVIALAVVIAIIALVLGRLGFALLAIGVVPLTLTAVFAVDATTERNSDGLWAIGSLMVLLCAAAGVALVSLLAQKR